MIRRAILAVMLLSGGMVLADPAGALAQALPTDRSELAYSYAPLVKRVSPAVVNIYTTTTARVQRRLPFPFPGMPQAGERVQNSLGSGVLVRPDGLIVTNAHVVKGADEIRVVLADRREFDAKVVTQDERYDLALVRIDGSGEKFPFLEMRDSDSIEVGDVVLAIGNPFGLNQTVTSGIISALARSAGGVNDSSFFIQTDAAINPGNSGGALVSLDGRLIGINMQRVTPDIAAGFNLPRPAGLVVKEVFPGGPGAHAGLKRNDVIIALKDQPIDDEASLRFRLATLQVDTTVPVKVIRGGKELVFDMKLAAPPEDPPRDPAVLEGRQPLSGAGVANLSPAVADELGLVEWRPGVIVTEVKAGSFAGRFVRPGDMILSVNGQDVKNVAELKKRIAAGVASVSIGREGMVSTVQFR